MAVPALLLVVVGLAGVVSVTRLERAAEDILSDNYRTIQQARRLERILRTIEETTPALAAKRLEAGEGRLSDAFMAALSACEENVTEEGEHAVLDRMRSDWRSIGPKVLPTEHDTASDPLGPTERMRLLAPIFAGIDRLVDINEKAMFAFERRERGVARLMLGVVATASGVALLTLILFAVVTATRISRPVLRIAADLERALAAGAPASPRAATGGDEIRTLRNALDDLLRRLSRYEEDQARRFGRLQARFAFVLEETREGLLLLDDDLTVVAVNRVGRELLGLRGEVPLRPTLSELPVRPEFAEVFEYLGGGAARGKREPGEIVLEADGSTTVLAPRILPFSTRGEEPAGFLVILWDVTHERRFEEARQRFIAMLSHQLKTPVTSLSMSVNLLWERAHGSGGEMDDLLDMARADCTTLTRLITELIDAARDVTPDLTLRLQRAEITRLLRRSLRPLFVQAREKGIDVEDRMGPGGQFAEVDVVKFPWVISNIFGNAIRYVEPGGRITLDLRRRPGQIEVSVADDGVGIDPEDLPGLFVPFTSLDDEPEPTTSGLGLSIAKEIIEAHHGSIDVESEVGVGTMFRVRVPIGEEGGT